MNLGQTFARFCRLSIDDGEWVYVIHPHVFSFQNIGPLDQYGISYDDLFDLDGAGLIRSAETLMMNFTEDPESKPEKFDYAGSTAYLNISGKQLHLLHFTKAGKELRRLLHLEPIPEYTKTLKERMGEDSFIVVEERD